MRQNELTLLVQNFSKKMKNTWQVIFLGVIVSYCLSLAHLFYVNPGINPAIEKYLRNIDLISYIIAIGLAVVIFSMKRKYFSRKFSQGIVTDSLRENPAQENEVLLKKVLGILNRKMVFIWLLGLFLVLDGVFFYWLTFSSNNNMHIYFVIGVYSLIINYPRSDLFNDLPWFVVEGKKEFQKGEQHHEI